jgi:RNA polymerase sigma factor (TIGR02999 family)
MDHSTQVNIVRKWRALHTGCGRGDMDVTRLLADWNGGDRDALDKLVPLVYAELHRIAGRQLARRGGPHTLQSTALVNEAYMRLASKATVAWNDRSHFFAVAARIIRDVLVDHARSHLAAKRGSGAVNLELDASAAATEPRTVDLLALDETLEKLARLDPQQATIVELRFFSGLSIEETAGALGISSATVKRDWTMARTWIFKELSPT